MMNHITRRTISLSLILSATFSQCGGLHFSPRIGIDSGLLSITQETTQDLPILVLKTNDAVFKATSDTENNELRTVIANDIYFPATATHYAISKDNLDAATHTLLFGGVQIRYLNDILVPSEAIYFAPVINAYGVMEDVKSNPNIASNFYQLKPKPHYGGDLGIALIRNGDSITLGGGAKVYKAELTTSSVFSALAEVTTDTAIELDTSAFRGEDKSPYKAQLDNLIMPYAYLEATTEVGDLLSVFVNVKYGIPVTPRFTEVPSDTQMFAGDQAAYEDSVKWQLSSVSFGISTSIDGII